MSSHAYAFGNRVFTCVHPTISRMIYKLVGRQLPIAVCRCKWLQGRIYGTVWSHLTCSGLAFNCLSLVSSFRSNWLARFRVTKYPGTRLKPRFPACCVWGTVRHILCQQAADKSVTLSDVAEKDSNLWLGSVELDYVTFVDQTLLDIR